MHRIVQLTDCHLFADPRGELRGIATWPRFRAVLQDLRARVIDFDLLLLTGDTAHDEALATYESVRQALGDWAARVRINPGNHDDRELLRRLFPESARPGEAQVNFCLRWTDWQVIGLDSQLPGEKAGRLGDAQLAWLHDRLQSNPTVPTLLFLHHPPIATQSPWLDAIGLQDAADLARLVEKNPQTQLIGSGHVHQELWARLGGATVFTTPAVGPQFRPRTEQLEIERLPPAYRLIELQPAGGWSTQVLHCPE